MTTSIAALTSAQVFDPDVYGNGDPATFGLPLDLFDRMREDEPCVKLELGHDLLVDEVWVVSRHEDIWAVDKDWETFAANRGLVNIWKFAPLDPVHKPAMLVQDGEEDEVVTVIDPEPGEDLRAKVERAVRSCPVTAITLED